MLKVGKLIKDEKGNVIRIEKEFYGQGYVFKDEDAYRNRENDTCYVAEGSDNRYSANDILKICEGRQDLADELFDELDWQHPESQLEDWIVNGEIVKCEKCGHLIDYGDGTGEKNCPKCGWEVDDGSC